MKKIIGILTSTPSFINNYGAILQAYALQTQLKKLSYDPYIIKYADANEYVQGRVKLIDRIKNILFSQNLSLQAKRKLIINKIVNKSVTPRFIKFQNEYIHFYNDKYIDYEGLKEISEKFYAFITGSDQVWNPNVHHGVNDPGYFLQFVPKEIKRISYAPSFGVDIIPETCKINLKEYISFLDFVSIREESGRKLIHDICGINIPVVVDPTLLLNCEDYDKIIDDSICPNNPYLVYYKFGRIFEIDSIILQISKKYGYKVICIPAGLETKFSPDYNIGPKEFIALISNANLVCTDSFHATVFSIIYNKPFLAFSREKENNNIPTMNSRIKNLLNMLKLDNCWVGAGESLDINNLPNPNYEEANEIRHINQDKGIKFLINALQ